MKEKGTEWKEEKKNVKPAKKKNLRRSYFSRRRIQKTIQRMSKMGVAKLSAEQAEELRWSLFICHVDAVISGKHLALRGDADRLAALTEDPQFKPS